MADYYPLIARAVEGLSDRSPAMRRAVYDRARNALLGQLRSLDPPLSDPDIEQESISLDDAIRRVEANYGEQEDVPSVAAFVDEPISDDRLRASVARSAPRSPMPEQTPSADASDAIYDDIVESAARPRVETRSPVESAPGRGRTIMLGSILAVIILAIAGVAFLLRDKPDDLPAQAPVAQADAQAAQQENGKFEERVGGPASNAKPAAPRQDVGVAQRAIFYEEDPANPQTPKAVTGRVIWRLETINGGQGQPLETAVRGIIEIPDASMTLNLLLRRNLDATLPASHTVELNFMTKPGDQGRVVRDVGLLQFKNEEAARGTPLAGLPVPVRENYFLIGLSNLAGDVERNVELFVRRSWIDLPVRMASGQRAILSFEKGASGEQVMNDAFRQWQ